MNRLSALALLTLTAACELVDPVDPDDLEVPDPVPALLAPVSGNDQTGGAGAPLASPLRVRVLDQFGQPLAGVPVTFSVVSGGGSVAPIAATSDEAGLASTSWTLGGELGEQEAQATTDPATTAARFTATAVAGTPADIVLGADTLRFDALGDTARVSVSASDAFGHPIARPDVTWVSDQPNRASVNDAGLVTATGNGTTRVIASAGGQADTVVVIVAQVATDLVLEPVLDTLIGADDTVRLRARVYDANGRAVTSPAPTVTWTSSDENVATVNASGRVGAVEDGSADIVATSSGVADTTTIVVRMPVALAIEPAADTAPAVGDTLRLRAVVTDSAGAAIPNTPVTWTSLDTLIARVDPYGRVTARDTGNARIVARWDTLADTAIVTVAPPPPPAPPRMGAALPGWDEARAASPAGPFARTSPRDAARRRGQLRRR